MPQLFHYLCAGLFSPLNILTLACDDVTSGERDSQYVEKVPGSQTQNCTFGRWITQSIVVAELLVYLSHLNLYIQRELLKVTICLCEMHIGF